VEIDKFVCLLWVNQPGCDQYLVEHLIQIELSVSGGHRKNENKDC